MADKTPVKRSPEEDGADGTGGLSPSKAGTALRDRYAIEKVVEEEEEDDEEESRSRNFENGQSPRGSAIP